MEPLSPSKSNKYYIFACVRARVGACAFVWVCVGARAREWAFARVALLIQHGTRSRHPACDLSRATIFFDIIS